MIFAIWIPIALLVGLALALSTRKARASTTLETDIDMPEESDITQTPRSSFREWVWPLLGINGSRPFISDGFHPFPTAVHRKTKKHLGHDIMRRIKESPEVFAANPDFLRGTLFRTTNHYLFPGEHAVAAGPGRIFSARLTETGNTVQISHIVDGKPLLTVYRHLAFLFPGVVKNAIVQPGSLLGPVGDNPAEAGDPVHLHFEVWDVQRKGKGRDADSINAQALMQRAWKVIDNKTGERLDWNTMGRVA